MLYAGLCTKFVDEGYVVHTTAATQRVGALRRLGKVTGPLQVPAPCLRKGFSISDYF
jgi:hypothetical protein